MIIDQQNSKFKKKTRLSTSNHFGKLTHEKFKAILSFSNCTRSRCLVDDRMNRGGHFSRSGKELTFNGS